MASKANIKKYAAHSAFVFIGKIIKPRAATMKEIITDKTMVMEVMHVINAPSAFAFIDGKQITVRFKKLPAFRAGKILTVFSNGWIFGDSIAVDAVGYTEEVETPAKAKAAKAGKNSMESMVQKAVTENKEANLKERIDSAEISVVGEVTKIKKSSVKPTHISEHNPIWHEATIKVDDVVKGKKDTKQVKVMFPASDDIRWRKINKYKTGQKGIWMLQKGKKQSPKGISAKVFAAIPSGEEVFTTLHENDFMPLDELSKVKSLVNQ
jgi:hypothetical protein